MIKSLSLLFLCFSISSIQKIDTVVSTQKGTLKIDLSNIRNNDGYIYIFLYQYKDQFPYNPYKHYKVNKSKVKNGVLTAQISNLDFKSNYAISLIDDENNNEDLDRWLGIPHEGYGFSNNVKPFLSMPEFNELLFDFKQSKNTQIKLQYVL
jgi:uncharacterized protein (DUF2141 family)